MSSSSALTSTRKGAPADAPVPKRVQGIQKAFEYWGPWRKRCDRCMMFWRFGEPDPRTRYNWQSKIRARTVRPNVEHIVATGTDYEPEIRVLPRNPGDYQRAAEMDALIQYDSARLGLRSINESAFRWMYVMGLAVYHVAWDPFAKQLVVELIDPRTYVWDPVPTLAQRRWDGRKIRIPRDILASVYGSKMRDVQGLPPTEGAALLGEGNERTAPVIVEPIVGADGKALFPKGDAPQGMERLDSDESVVIVEQYTWPRYVTQDGEADLVPGKRYLLSADEELECTEPYDDKIDHPSAFVPVIFDEASFEDGKLNGPSGMVEQVIPNECTMGRMLRMYEDHTFLECRPWLMADQNSDVTEASLRDPRHFLPYRATAAGKAPSWLQAAGLSPDFATIYRFYEENRNRIWMIEDVDIGRAPGEIRSGVGIEALQQKMNKAVRTGVRHHIDALKVVGRMMTSREAQFRDEEFTYLVTDSHGQVQYDPTTNQPVFGEIPGARIEPVYDDETGEPVYEGAKPKIKRTRHFEGLKFDVDIRIGAAQPVAMPGGPSSGPNAGAPLPPGMPPANGIPSETPPPGLAIAA